MGWSSFDEKWWICSIQFASSILFSYQLYPGRSPNRTCSFHILMKQRKLQESYQTVNWNISFGNKLGNSFSAKILEKLKVPTKKRNSVFLFGRLYWCAVKETKFKLWNKFQILNFIKFASEMKSGTLCESEIKCVAANLPRSWFFANLWDLIRFSKPRKYWPNNFDSCHVSNDISKMLSAVSDYTNLQLL